MGALYESYKMVESNEGQVVQTISSREVAEMMEMQHKHLLEKIDKINETFEIINQLEIPVFIIHGKEDKYVKYLL